MKFSASHLALATSAIAATLATTALSATAASITYDIEVTPDFGPLVGETYFGSFTFDDSAVTGSDFESIAVDDLSFNFLGVDYTETDDFFGGAVVDFFDGELLGVAFDVEGLFSFLPGFFDVSEASFYYEIDGTFGGGDVSYALQETPPSESVPEPGMAITLLLFGTGLALRQRRA